MRRYLILSLLLLAVLAFLAACVATPPQQASTVPAPAQAPALAPAQPALAPAGPTLGSQRSGDLLVWLAARRRSHGARPRWTPTWSGPMASPSRMPR